jgi:cellulose synthase/poly-beta-1,6-N-acetylglucosamine synthase-like glycosyltransferase
MKLETALENVEKVPMVFKYHLLAYGLCFIAVGFCAYVFGVLLAFPRNVLGLGGEFLRFNEILVWYSGVPVFIGFALSAIDLFVLLPKKRLNARTSLEPVGNRSITVVLTAYNDEEAIGAAVADFAAHPAVSRVIVVDNNSTDETSERARSAGAIVVAETLQGYGRCVYRCLTEGLNYPDTELTLLCEGDRTFRASDIDKFFAYIDHAHIVNGTRTCEQLREFETQMSTFMYYGNFFVGKLLEAKHVGQGTFTDVGTTYKLIRNDALRGLMPFLDPSVNLEFNPHFLDKALSSRLMIVECPITFFPRVGKSKGGNINNLRAFSVGCRMIKSILFGWKGSRAA